MASRQSLWCAIRFGAERLDIVKAFIIDRYGTKDGGRIGEMPEPELCEISALIDAGAIRPVVDRVFPFESTKEAMAYVNTGRAKGKVVVKMRRV